MTDMLIPNMDAALLLKQYNLLMDIEREERSKIYRQIQYDYRNGLPTSQETYQRERMDMISGLISLIRSMLNALMEEENEIADHKQPPVARRESRWETARRIDKANGKEIYEEFCADMLETDLTKREVDILAMRCGYYKGRRSHTRRYARHHLKLTVGQLRESEKKALRKLKHPSRLKVARKWGFWEPGWNADTQIWERVAGHKTKEMEFTHGEQEETESKNKHEKKRQSQRIKDQETTGINGLPGG